MSEGESRERFIEREPNRDDPGTGVRDTLGPG
jgi:hypothetical protein